MTKAIALTKSDSPSPQSQSSVATHPKASESASLCMYEAKPSKGGGSEPGDQVDSIAFQFNPKEITISKSAKWGSDSSKSSKNAGPVQFLGADPCKLTVELFFDATLNSDQKVVESVEKLMSCCVPQEKSRSEKKPMPPLVVFKWGGITSFPAYVTQVNAKYTRFASNGIPIRAVCTVNLQEMPSEAGKQNPTSGVLAVERVHTMVTSDHLALVAHKEYGSAALWRPLAAYNGIDDPMRIPDGTQILLPAADVLLT